MKIVYYPELVKEAPKADIYSDFVGVGDWYLAESKEPIIKHGVTFTEYDKGMYKYKMSGKIYRELVNEYLVAERLLLD